VPPEKLLVRDRRPLVAAAGRIAVAVALAVVIVVVAVLGPPVNKAVASSASFVAASTPSTPSILPLPFRTNKFDASAALLTFEATAIGVEEEEDANEVVVLFRRLLSVVANAAELSDKAELLVLSSLILLCNVISFKWVDAVAASVDDSKLLWSLLMSIFLLRAAETAVVVGLSLTNDPINKEWNAAVVVVAVGAAGMATTGKARALPRMMESPAAVTSTDRKCVHGCDVMVLDIVVVFGRHFPLPASLTSLTSLTSLASLADRRRLLWRKQAEKRIHQFNLT
jgi:hypothetical protein